MRRRLILASIAAALVLGALVIGAGARPFARQGGPRGFHHGPPSPEMMIAHMTADLGLSADQATQIKAIFEAERTANEPNAQKMRDLGDQIRAAGAGGQFDETKVRALARQQADLMVELTVSRERSRAAVYAVLTPDQRTKFDSLPHPPGPPPGE
jgi:Spy/CpxP family protein refolding chaperone